MEEVAEKREWTASALVQRAWLSGYLTGKNHAHWETSPQRQNVLADLGPAGQEFAYQWMDAYCKAHPTEDADIGGRLLFRSLVALVPPAKSAVQGGAGGTKVDGATVAAIRARLMTLAQTRSVAP